MMAWHLFDTKPLPEPMLTYQLDLGKQFNENLLQIQAYLFEQENASI